MSIFTPYDGFEPEGDSFLAGSLEFLLEMGAGIWLFLFSPIGMFVASIAWLFWGGIFLLVSAVVGISTMIIGTIISSIFLFRLLVSERGRDDMSSITKKLALSGVSLLVVSSLSGLLTIAYCINRIVG